MSDSEDSLESLSSETIYCEDEYNNDLERSFTSFNSDTSYITDNEIYFNNVNDLYEDELAYHSNPDSNFINMIVIMKRI
eukprot:jgi/Orpsp1_1/1191966/evm.model.d7180000089694.1